MMKALLKKMAYSSSTIILCVCFALMAWMDYSSDGDRVNLAFAIVLTGLAILGVYFEFFHTPREAEDE